MSVLILTTGQPGAGKTYSRVLWLVTDFLLNSDGIYITNLPLKVDLICEYVSKKTGKSVEDIKKRIHIIPDDVMRSWRDLSDRSKKQELMRYKENNDFPPAKYFESFQLDNARIAIDEFHRYFNKKSPSDLSLLWNDWFAEIRKLGCSFEAITQTSFCFPPDCFKLPFLFVC